MTRLALRLFGRAVYGEYANRLPLLGDEMVLDFGCGMGTVAHYVAAKLPQGHLTCADISDRWLDACRKTLRGRANVSFESAIPKGPFDLIYCHFVLHDIPDGELEAVLPALSESLQPNGLLAFREPLRETAKLARMQVLLGQSGLSRRDCRVTDVPLMGNALECIYFRR
ncbi:MAG: class I SAM-dependent methyltransferase [Clostridiales bacterium]|nr:class I SAM-dependent methyltransferase [Clostridiales bacterium]